MAEWAFLTSRVVANETKSKSHDPNETGDLFNAFRTLY